MGGDLEGTGGRSLQSLRWGTAHGYVPLNICEKRYNDFYSFYIISIFI